MSELEVDEGLDVARLDLHDAPDHRGGQQHLQRERCAGDHPLCGGIDAGGQEVQQVARGDKGEDAGVSGHDLRDHRRVEVVEDLVEHQ